MYFLPYISLLFCTVYWLVGVKGNTVCHDENFVPDAVLRITEQVLSQSCLPSRPTVVVNGTTPGPEIRLKEGITYWIRIYNDMSDKNLTMHWHGLSMAVSPFADGTPQVSQWPIPPLHYFDYEIRVPVGMAGSYFYHSHVGFQAVSASGPLIVEEKGSPPYAYDEEKIFFLQDLFVKNDTTIEQGLIANPLNWSGEAEAILVNGKGAGTSNGTACNASLSIIDVEPGKTYRFRFISNTALTFTSLAIQGHNLTVIGADGAYSEPYETEFLQIATGQRYDILLHAKAEPDLNQSQYWIQLESRERPTLTRGYAILNYGKKSNATVFPPPAPVMTLPNITYGFLDYVLHPLVLPTSNRSHTKPETFPTAQEVTRTVTLTVHQAVRGQTVWLENSYNWTQEFPSEPYLVSLYNKDGIEFPDLTRALANNGLDPVTRAFPAALGEVLEIVIYNTGADAGGLDAHPFHAHGAHYWDLGSGNGTYNSTANDEKWAAIDASPIKRDTTMLYRYGMTTGNGTVQGWRAWRLRVTEPGAWMIHCHILQHMLMGMQTIWVMGNSSQVLHRVPPGDVTGYLTYGGNVTGNENRYPSVVHYFDDWATNQKRQISW